VTQTKALNILMLEDPSIIRGPFARVIGLRSDVSMHALAGAAADARTGRRQLRPIRDGSLEKYVYKRLTAR
jgi:hypothetical protein